MSRKSSIKWGSSDTQKLNKQIKSFNNKIYKARKRHPELTNILPDIINKEKKKELTKELKSSPRNEFNKAVNSLSRFNAQSMRPITSKTGNTISKWEKKEVGLKVSQINRERTKTRKTMEDLEVTTRGEKTGLKRGEMGSVRMNELKPKTFNFDKIKGGKEWDKYKKGIEKMALNNAKNERMEAYKQNYIKALENVYGEYAYDLIRVIKEIPAETVVKTFYSEQEATIDFHYDPQAMQFKLDTLQEIWENVSNDLE